MTTAYTAAAARQAIPVVPHVAGQCASSPQEIPDDVPVGSGRLGTIVAIAKMILPNGALTGYVYRTADNALLIQRINPPMAPARYQHNWRGFRETGLLPFPHVLSGVRLVPCGRTDFKRALTNHAKLKSIR